jgi:hypothetical protein
MTENNDSTKENPFISMIKAEREISKNKALDALSRYKFWMFGYHAAAWVKYNQLLPMAHQEESPFSPLVKSARDIINEPKRIAYLKKCEEKATGRSS